MKYKLNCSNILALLIIVLSTAFLDNLLYSQGVPASPARWMYPEGNAASTKYIGTKSKAQYLDSMVVKWTSDYISGDVQLLIGNIVNNPRIIDDASAFPYAPNEIVAVIGDNLLILNGAGKLLANQPLVDNKNNGLGILSISALLDTTATYMTPNNTAHTLILGLESIESKRTDNLAVAYIGGWNQNKGEFSLLQRLALNLNTDYLPNTSASLKPIYAKHNTSEFGEDVSGFSVYAAVNMSQPSVSSSSSDIPFFRGLTKYDLYHVNIYPTKDPEDDVFSRVYLGPQVSFAQPSISNIRSWEANTILLPCLPTPTSTNDIVENTFPDEAYLFSYTYTSEGLDTYESYAISIDDGIDTKPRIRPYFVELNDPGSFEGEKEYILMTTEYNGITGNNGSRGRAGLFLYETDGTPLFDLDVFFNKDAYPFFGGQDHYWSVAIGDIDGNASNEFLPCYPNNYGKEIVVTQSSRSFAYPASKLMILRYNTGSLIPKTSPPGEYLRQLDTICTQTIKGWVVAVNDIDGQDGKDEILLVGGSDLMLLRMNDYLSEQFRYGDYFDTVFAHTFPNQTIMSAAISDLDGDGLNDIIVTTNEGLFILGTPLSRTIAITNSKPTDPDYKINYCFGDTITITWNNIIQGNNAVNIYLQLFDENNMAMTDSLISLEENYPNAQDSMSYSFVVDTTLAGLKGKVIIQSATNPTKNSDSTGLFAFNKPQAWLDTGGLYVIYSGMEITIEGKAACTDSITLLYSFTQDSTAEWVAIGSAVVDDSDNFVLTTNMPCLDFFECNSLRGDSVIFGRVIYNKHSLVDSSDIFPMTIKPATFPITIDTCESICPSRIIKWDFGKGDTALTNVNINVLISQDRGKTFQFIETVPLTAGIYEWHVPTNMADTILLRLCSEETCLRTDTLIWNYNAKYIKTVAPNPLKIPYEAEIVYTIDEDTEVTMRIVDQANLLVRELVRNSPRLAGFVYCEKWDGRLSDQTPAANGMYYIFLELSNGFKEIYPIFIRN